MLKETKQRGLFKVFTRDDAPPHPHIKSVLHLTPEQYLEDRVIYKIDVYAKLSERYRRLYLLMSVIAIVAAALVPVVINIGGNDVIATILSLIVTVLVSLEKLFHFREHWRNYDNIEAQLRREQLYFQTRAEDYHNKDDEQAFRLFVRRVEEAIKAERNETIEMRTQQTET